jgi:tRNA (adenine57-N1/adenine58-N1)-methyltransferase catalytic subunit
LYPADIALATALMELAPGSVVLECGTGSGSLTHALARAVHPGGVVHTFEFHAGRAAAAAAEFGAHGLGGVVVGHVRDVQAKGFGAAFEAATADAVFLDLPAPWSAVPSAAACLRPDGVLCSFSPCVEQVQRTCAALARTGAFTAPVTHELLLRAMDVRREKLVTDVLGGGGGKGKRARGESGGEEEEAAGTARAGVVVAKPDAIARGHTGYLTFARRAVEKAG